MKYLFVFLLVGLMVSCAETKYYKNGNLKWQMTENIDKYWYENGQIKSEWNRKDEVRKEWYENGQLHYEWLEKDGKDDGLQRAWFENGQIKYELLYKNGEKISDKRWDKDGNIEE